jgi:hypothetical protein
MGWTPNLFRRRNLYNDLAEEMRLHPWQFLLAAAMIAVWIPARRAATIELTWAIRVE